MSVEKANNDFKQRVHFLTGQIIEQARNALSTKETEKLFAEQSTNSHMLEQGKISQDDFLGRQQAIVNKLKPVVMGNLGEFLACLRGCGLTEDQVGEIAAHENDHMRVAEAHGLHGNYAIVHSLSATDEYITHPFMTHSRTSRDVQRAITLAPEKLSPSDKVWVKRQEEN